MGGLRVGASSCRVTVRRTIAATHMTAGHAQSKMDPLASRLQALLTPLPDGVTLATVPLCVQVSLIAEPPSLECGDGCDPRQETLSGLPRSAARLCSSENVRAQHVSSCARSGSPQTASRHQWRISRRLTARNLSRKRSVVSCVLPRGRTLHAARARRLSSSCSTPASTLV